MEAGNSSKGDDALKRGMPMQPQKGRRDSGFTRLEPLSNYGLPGSCTVSDHLSDSSNVYGISPISETQNCGQKQKRTGNPRDARMPKFGGIESNQKLSAETGQAKPCNLDRTCAAIGRKFQPKVEEHYRSSSSLDYPSAYACYHSNAGGSFHLIWRRVVPVCVCRPWKRDSCCDYDRVDPHLNTPPSSLACQRHIKVLERRHNKAVGHLSQPPTQYHPGNCE